MTNNMEMTATNKGINVSGCKGKQVRCIETNVIYRSASEAAKANNICYSLLSDVCRGKWKAAKGLHFEYVDAEKKVTPVTEAVPVTENEITVSRPAIIKGKGKRSNGNTNAVMCISTGEVFTSCTDAAEHSDVSVGQMSHTCRNKGSHAKGKQYCYIKDIDMHLDEISDAISKKNAYQVLLAKENRRKQLKNMIADYKGDIARLENELAETYALLNKTEQELINMD